MSDDGRQDQGPRRPLGRARIPFRLKLLLLSVTLAIVPIAGVSAAFLEELADTLLTAQLDLQLQVTDDVARSLDAEMRAAQDALEGVGRTLVDARLPEDVAPELATTLVAADDAIDMAAIYDARGGLIDVIRERGAADVTPPERLDAALLATARSEQVATGEAVPSADGARALIVVPLRVGDTISGYAATLAPLSRVQRLVSRLSELRFGEDGVYVVDHRYRAIAHPDAELADALAELRSEGIFEGVPELRPGLQKSGEHTARDGTKMVGTLVVLHDRPWGVVVQVPESQAYERLTRLRTIVLRVLLVAIVLALIVAISFARRITRPVAALADFARDLAERRFDRRITIQTSDELSLLGEAMSGAAEELERSDARIKEEVAIRSDLGRYLAAPLVDKVVRREQDMALGGSRRQISVLFADVVAFTPLTEEMSPEDIVGLLNELFTILTEIVFRHGGTIDKFIGDCVMAIWGAPEEQPDHAERAVAAAEEMMQWLEAGNDGWQDRYGVRIELAIGVNTGEAVVGNIGSETRMEYTAIGDTVNVAARLETIARPGQILVTDATRDAAGDLFDYLDVGDKQLTGRAQPIHLWAVRA